MLARAEGLVHDILASPEPAPIRLQRMILELHRFTCEQYLQESKVHEIVTKAMDEQWAVIDAHVTRLRAAFQQVLDDGVRDGEFRHATVADFGDCLFNAVLPFCHPQLVAERFALDEGRQARAMALFLTSALQAGSHRQPA